MSPSERTERQLRELLRIVGEPHKYTLMLCATPERKAEARSRFTEIAGDEVLKQGINGVHLKNGSVVYFKWFADTFSTIANDPVDKRRH